MALGQTRTKAHSNEITALPELLKALELKGCPATIDDMGCQKNIAQQVVQGRQACFSCFDTNRFTTMRSCATMSCTRIRGHKEDQGYRNTA